MSAEGKKKGESLSPSDFVHLHCHTNYSVLDGLTRVNDLCEFVKENGMTAVAMTDHGTVSGWIDLYKNATEQGIKPIFGIEAYMATRKHTDRDPARDKQRFHATLLSMNNEGYRNIMRLSSIANLEGMYYKPRIDHELLEKYNEGIICLSGCAGGELGNALKDDNYDEAIKIAKWHKEIFGDRYYIELQDHGHPDAPKYWDIQQKVNEGALKIAKELDIPAVLTCDAHYLKASDGDAHEILLCVGTGAYLSDTKRMTLADFDLHVIEPESIIERWGKDHPEVIKNTKVIADRCDVTLDLGGILIPKFPCPDGKNEEQYLHELVWSGLAKRYGVSSKDKDLSEEEARKVLTKEVVERADYELNIIHEMGFDGYFLIVWDFINWGKSQKIVFGPGRGSAAGSIISYSLKITDLDPLKYDLLFERFLNPDRISMPDIDIDIQDTRRNEVIEYCTQKYGADRVSNIGTFGKMMARNAYKDVARVLEVPFAESNRVSALIPAATQGKPIPLKDSIKDDPDLKKEYDSNPKTKECIDYAIQLEGTIRSHGVHAAGVVIAPDELVKYAPLEMAQKGVVATQFPMGPIEELGLLKMDFLGLKNLTIINNALRIVKRVYKKEIDIYDLPMDDKKTYELFQNGETTGVFQFESAGMKRYLKELKPTVFDDLIAMVALYRPGPMSEIPDFINRKHGKSDITYYDSHMEDALKDTYGILVYQEQFMQISKDIANFTGGEADTLRKAIGKKKIDLMRTMKQKFIDGAVEHVDADRDSMEAFWTHLEDFASYCFNKSHAACYALVAYWTAYIKAHYPSAFMAALMTSDSRDTERLAIEIGECNRMGVKVLLPDVNESYSEFAVVPESGDIRFGLSAVKGVGVAVVEKIEEARSVGGPFLNVEDYAKRVSAQASNKKVWENLIKAGAFDRFGDRSDLLFNIEAITEYSRKVQAEAANGQTDLFGVLADSGVDIDSTIPGVDIKPAPSKYTEKEMLGWERELMGLYLSAHPLDKYNLYFSEMTVPIADIKSDDDGYSATIGGVINQIRTIVTKNQQKMAFATLEDQTGEIEVTVFPKTFETSASILEVDKVIKATGKIDGKDFRTGTRLDDPKFGAFEITEITDNELDNYQPTGKKATIQQSGPRSRKSAKTAEKIDKPQRKEKPMFEAAPPTQKKVYLHVRDLEDAELLTKTRELLSKHPGDSVVVMVLGEEKKDSLKLPFGVDVNNDLVTKLNEIYEENCVVVK